MAIREKEKSPLIAKNCKMLFPSGNPWWDGRSYTKTTLFIG